jgi:hypothetical protein
MQVNSRNLYQESNFQKEGKAGKISSVPKVPDPSEDSGNAFL